MTGEGIITDQQKRNGIYLSYFKSLFYDITDEAALTSAILAMNNNQNYKQIFKIQDVKNAIEATNFNKGMGNDGFCGKVLKQNEEICDNYAFWAY